MSNIDVSLFSVRLDNVIPGNGIDNVKNGSDRHLQDCLSDEGA
jgi:hypothetical protein